LLINRVGEFANSFPTVVTIINRHMEERPSKALSRSLTRTFTINKPVTTPVQTPTSSDYKHQYDQITHVIEGMNEKLADKFHRRESEVLDSYKSEL